MEKTYITQALSNLGFVGSCLTENELVTDWLGNTPIDETLITAEVTRLQAEFDSQQYARDRASAYPSLTDQADMAYWDRKNGTTTLDDAITAVKSAHPKI
jgi:hypothetical protein